MRHSAILVTLLLSLIGQYIPNLRPVNIVEFLVARYGARPNTTLQIEDSVPTRLLSDLFLFRIVSDHALATAAEHGEDGSTTICASVNEGNLEFVVQATPIRETDLATYPNLVTHPNPNPNPNPNP